MKPLVEERALTITTPLLAAYLKCPTKCWHRSGGEQVTGGTYAQWFQAQDESYCTTGIHQLLSERHQGECIASPSADNLKAGKWRLATNVLARIKMMESDVHAVERLPSEGRGKPAQFIPIRFDPTNKPGKDAKLLLAFDALLLSEMLGHEVSLGKLIHGDDYAVLNVNTSTLAVEVRKHIDKTVALLSSSSPPDLVLIRHCTECEFEAQCRQKAMEKDDLSLLSGMTAKERKKLHNKGVFTVTQLSYTFRPRRRSKRLRHKQERYQHPLRALALREKKIHIVGSPELKIEGTPIYIDVEGLPDRDFYYLIGMRLGSGTSAIQHSFWANNIKDEKKIWTDLLGMLAKVQNPVLIHYGSYETTFFKRMCDRYGFPPEQSSAERALKTSVNLLSVIFVKIYFPTFSNGLKDIGHFLGVTWDSPVRSGLQSLAVRLDWEQSHDPTLKALLVAYNRDDCIALSTILFHLSKIIRDANSRADIEFSYSPKRVATDTGAEVHNTLQSVLRSAHFSYARSRIKISSAKRDQAAHSKKEDRKKRPRRKAFSSIKGTVVQVPRKRTCPEHPGHKLTVSSKTAQCSLLDLTFNKGGCRKTIVRYAAHLGNCNLCHKSYAPPGIRRLRNQCFGWNVQAWVIYQRLALRMSYRLISRAVHDLFAERLSLETACAFVGRVSEHYRHTEELLLHRILDGPAVHIDETKISIQGADQYVWVFTDNVRVVFRLRPNRETEFLKPLLASFTGTLISDFYGGYDALSCRQQKCLVHLIRDLNDDLWKNPFDDEFERFIVSFRDLIAPIFEDVKRFGLKVRHLRKHRRRVERFYRQTIIEHAPTRETTARYRKRFLRYKDSLFSFLENDGIPWHNNTAERALRHFAVQRKISGSFSEKGAEHYLRLLGIAQTCRFQQKSFLGFLLSKSTDVDEYRERGRVHPDWAAD